MNTNYTPASTLNVSLDFNPTADTPTPTVFTKQADALWRSISVKLTKSGAVFVKPAPWDIKLRGTKPDGTAFDLLPAEEDTEKGIYTFVLTKNILAVCGTIVCDIVCSALADRTYICSTQVFYINNLASAVDNNASYSQTAFATVEEAVYNANTATEAANTAAENANTAAANAIKGATAATTAGEAANLAAQQANSAAERAENAARLGLKPQDILGCATIRNVWVNQDDTGGYSGGEITVPNGKNDLFYILKYIEGLSKQNNKTAFVYPDKNTVISGTTVNNQSATRTVVCTAVGDDAVITVSSDGINGTACIPMVIYAIGVK